MKVKKCVFVDETGLNREQRRLPARAKRGVKIHATKSGKRTKRVNIIGGLVYGKTAERYIAVQCSAMSIQQPEHFLKIGLSLN